MRKMELTERAYRREAAAGREGGAGGNWGEIRCRWRMRRPDHLEDEMMLQSQWSWPKVSTLGPAATGLDSIITFA